MYFAIYLPDCLWNAFLRLSLVLCLTGQMGICRQLSSSRTRTLPAGFRTWVAAGVLCQDIGSLVEQTFLSPDGTVQVLQQAE